MINTTPTMIQLIAIDLEPARSFPGRIHWVYVEDESLEGVYMGLTVRF